MPKGCIKLGEWNKPYKYLFLTIIFSLLKDFSLGASNEAVFEVSKALDGGDISNCSFVREALCYFFTIIMSLILYNIHLKNTGGNEYNQSSTNLDDNEVRKRHTGNILLIHTEREMINYPNYKLLIIIFSWVLEEEFLSLIKNTFLHLDFWMLELIMAHFFMIKILKIKVYDHQKLMLWFCGFPLYLN